MAEVITNEKLIFLKGNSSNLPPNADENKVYCVIDTGEILIGTGPTTELKHLTGYKIQNSKDGSYKLIWYGTYSEYNSLSTILDSSAYIISDIALQARSITNNFNLHKLQSATNGLLGHIKIGYTASGKTYPVELNNDNMAFVNVPWTDTDTHYIAKNIIGSSNSSTSNVTAITSNPFLNLFENSTIRSNVQFVGGGNTTVTTNATGTIITFSTIVPTIPNISIQNGSISGNQYISGLTASGHTINVSKGTLPTTLPNSEPLILKINSGTTEGSNLYTYTGAIRKILNIVEGSNISLTTTTEQLTINALIPNITVTNGGVSGGQYISGLTASGHTINVSKGTLPTTLPNPQSLNLKINSGTTEGTDLYTYKGDTGKTLNIVGGSNINLTTAAGQLTINASVPTIPPITITNADGIWGQFVFGLSASGHNIDVKRAYLPNVEVVNGDPIEGQYVCGLTVNKMTISPLRYYLPTALPNPQSLNLKINSGTTEGTDLYTYKGDTGKTLNIVGGSNINLTTAAGQLTISASVPTIPSITVSNSGSGNAITSLTTSGHTINVVKGETFATQSSLFGADGKLLTRIIPDGALSKLSIAANEAKAVELITNKTVQNGDTVQVTANNNTMYYVADDTKTTFATIFNIYRAGQAVSAQIADVATKVSNVLTFNGGVSGSYDGSSALTITIPSMPTIPNISISNGGVSGGQYISGLTASGHTINVSKGTLPSTLPNPQSLNLKINSGTTEGTDLYTYKGDTGKTLNIVGGSNINLTTAAGQLTINASVPTIPSITITNADGIGGQYISGLTASGHTINVLRSYLPKVGVANGDPITGQYICGLTANENVISPLRCYLPTTLPNPQSLTFNGAVSGSYNGSSALTITIPDSTSYDIATINTKGLVKPISVINKPTLQSLSTDYYRYYSVQMSTDGNMFVNVPWYDSDTDTTYTFASGADGNFTVTPLYGSAQSISIGKPATAGTADLAYLAIRIQNEYNSAELTTWAGPTGSLPSSRATNTIYYTY